MSVDGPTGSGLERAMECDASNVLPRAWPASSIYAESGIALHAYLQRISDGATLEESLAQVDEEYRDSCESHDLHGLKLEQYSAEVTLVINLVTTKSRIHGQNLDRDYSGIEPDDVPMTIDLVGVDLPNRRGKVGDHKRGWSKRTPAAENWQLLGPATALADRFDLDEVDAELIHHREGKKAWIDRTTFTAADFATARVELRDLRTRTIANRARFARGEHVEPTEGLWCEHCPGRWSCPAKIGTIRAALALDPTMAIIPADAAALLKATNAQLVALGALKTRIYGLAAMEPGGFLLEVDYEAETETWLRDDVTEGNEKLSPDIAIDVASKVLEVPADQAATFVRAVAKLEVTKGALQKETMKRAPKKQGGKTFDRIVEEIRARGGAPRKTRAGVQVVTVPMRAKTEAA